MVGQACSSLVLVRSTNDAKYLTILLRLSRTGLMKPAARTSTCQGTSGFQNQMSSSRAGNGDVVTACLINFWTPQQSSKPSQRRVRPPFIVMI